MPGSAMDPAVPAPVSPWWGVLVGLGLFLIAVGVCWWNWRHAEPVGTPPPVEPWKAINDGFNTHAETAAALTIPDLDPWLPPRVDPDDDIDGVEIDVPFAVDEEAAFAAIIGPLGADRTYRRRVESLEKQMETKTS